MMKNAFKITITTPCRENWNAMTPNEKGRHCASCEKTVIDFSQKTDREISKIVKKGGSLCGRFKQEQLERPIALPRKRDTFFEIFPPSYAAALMIPMAIVGTQDMNAQESTANSTITVTTSPTPPQYPPRPVLGRISVQPALHDIQVIQGIVQDESTPLPGAVITVKGTKRSTRTNLDGNFEIEARQDEILIISHIGYVSQEKTFNTKGPLTITLEPNMIMGDIIIVGEIEAVTTKPPKSKKKS